MTIRLTRTLLGLIIGSGMICSTVGADTGPRVILYTTRTQETAAETDPIRLEIHRADCKLAICCGPIRIKTYPIAVGRAGWETPLGQFKVLQLVRNPVWKHPLTGKIYPPGDPKNELGRYWIGFWNDGDTCIGFHGTPHPATVGKSVSHGCVRMYNKDIEELFSQVRLGTTVAVVP
jgi:lipoprotein-anchoring transpeptidase ErfK/SrfK